MEDIMFGTIIGNIIGITFFLSFQLLGIWIALYLFQKETLALSVLLGSAFGSFALHWLPTLYAFLFDFTIQAHVAALVTFVLLAIIVYTKEKEHFSFTELKIKRRIKNEEISSISKFHRFYSKICGMDCGGTFLRGKRVKAYERKKKE